MFKKFILRKDKVDLIFNIAKSNKGFDYNEVKNKITFGEKKDIVASYDYLTEAYSVFIVKINLETESKKEKALAEERLKTVIEKICKDPSSIKGSYLEVTDEDIEKISNLLNIHLYKNLLNI